MTESRLKIAHSWKTKAAVEPTADMNNLRSIFVVADTHFGLRKKEQRCDPTAFSDFINWIMKLERNGKEELVVGIWGEEGKEEFLKPPEKIIFLGDILELWDASKKSIDACTRSIIQSLGSLSCEKLYVLGNHDYDLDDLIGEYPLGSSKIEIMKKEYATEKGERKFVFLHGHQFDKFFEFPSWRILSYIREAGMVFGLYSWIFVVMLAIDLILSFSLGLNGLTDIMISLLLGTISVPFLVTKYGRSLWNRIKSTRHKPDESRSRLEKWYKQYTKGMPSKDLNVVFGHTHVIDFWSKTGGNNKLRVFNIPSWVRDSTKIEKISLDKVFRHAFLYVDDVIAEFIGWDTREKKPFLIPKDIITERRLNGDITLLETQYEIERRLLEIGWPPELIEKWTKFNVTEAIKPAL